MINLLFAHDFCHHFHQFSKVEQICVAAHTLPYLRSGSTNGRCYRPMNNLFKKPKSRESVHTLHALVGVFQLVSLYSEWNACVRSGSGIHCVLANLFSLFQNKLHSIWVKSCGRTIRFCSANQFDTVVGHLIMRCSCKLLFVSNQFTKSDSTNEFHMLMSMDM